MFSRAWRELHVFSRLRWFVLARLARVVCCASSYDWLFGLFAFFVIGKPFCKSCSCCFLSCFSSLSHFIKSKNKKAAALPFVLAAPLDSEKGRG